MLIGFSIAILAQSQAAILNVPGGYATVQAAIDAAQEGDEIVVAPGTYQGRLILTGRNIILRSSNPYDWTTVKKTIIDGGTSYPAVTFNGNESEKCVLRGLTITRFVSVSGGTARGIAGQGTHAAIEYNYISNHNTTNVTAEPGHCDPFRGGGLFECNGLIQNNMITNNAANEGGGLYGCNGTIQNNVIWQNGVMDASWTPPHGSQQTIIRGSGAAMLNCNGPIRNNTIVDNYIFHTIGVNSIGGLSNCKGTITNNIFWDSSDKVTEYTFGTCSTPTYCLMKAYSGPGEGNLSGDPKFIDPANGDFRLRADSPGIDAGKGIAELKFDMLNRQRGLKAATQPRGDGSGYDIGAYEVLPKPVAVWLPNGGPAAVPEGQQLRVSWSLEPTAGTAINLRLMRGGRLITDYGNFSSAAGFAWNNLKIPMHLIASANYIISGISLADRSLCSNSAPFAVQGSILNAVTPTSWLQYE